MRPDGGLAAAIAVQRVTPKERPRDNWEGSVLRAQEAVLDRGTAGRLNPGGWRAKLLDDLAASEDAADAWHYLQEQHERWNPSVDALVVLKLVIRSALLASFRDGLPNGASTSAQYEGAVAAASLLHGFFVARSGLSEGGIEALGPGDAPNAAADMVGRLELILDYLVVERNMDLIDVDHLPRPNSRGQGAQARAFAYALSTFLARCYGRPFSEFPARVSAVLYPHEEMPDVASVARQRRREKAERSSEWKALLKADEARVIALRGEPRDATDEDPWELPDVD